MKDIAKYSLLNSSLFILSINSEPAGIPFNKSIYIDIDIAYKLEKDTNVTLYSTK